MFVGFGPSGPRCSSEATFPDPSNDFGEQNVIIAQRDGGQNYVNKTAVINLNYSLTTSIWTPDVPPTEPGRLPQARPEPTD